jgi:hypothetical protein
MRANFSRNVPDGVRRRRKATTRTAAKPQMGMLRSTNTECVSGRFKVHRTEKPSPLAGDGQAPADNRSDSDADSVCTAWVLGRSIQFHKWSNYMDIKPLNAPRSRKETKSDTMIWVKDIMPPTPRPWIATESSIRTDCGVDLTIRTPSCN